MSSKSKGKLRETEIGMIPEDWEVKELKELLSEKGYIRGPFGSVLRRPELKKEGVPVYEQQNAIYNHRVFKFYIDKEKYEELKRFTVAENDLIISCSGTFGKVSIIQKEDPKGIISQALLILRPDTRKVNPHYLKYFFKSNKGYHAIESRSLGSVQVNIAKREIIEKIELTIPKDRKEQDAIVKTLSDLDSKIELNHQMNATLEKIGQALFKHWFIDFEFPNEKGKPYKSSGGEMVDSELGEIPVAWRVGKLGDLVHVEIGGDWGQNERFEGSVQTICLRGVDLQSLKEKGYSSDAPQRWIKKSSLEKRSISDCDILIGASGLGPVGRSLYCSDSLQHLYEFPLTYSNFCKRLRAISSDYAVYLEKLLEDIYLSGDMQNYITGTSVPNLDINGLLNRQIIIPDEELVIKYSNYAKNRFRKLFNKENIILSRIRDSLLPRLMSGKIRVGLAK